MIDAAAALTHREVDRIVVAILTIRNVTARKRAVLELAEVRNLLNGLMTGREKEILGMIVNGSSLKGIGYELDFNPRTV